MIDNAGPECQFELKANWLASKSISAEAREFRLKPHRNIAAYYGYIIDGSKRLLIISEFVNGATLYATIRSAGRLDKLVAVKVVVIVVHELRKDSCMKLHLI